MSEKDDLDFLDIEEDVVAKNEPVVAEDEPVIAEPEPLIAEPEPVVALPEESLPAVPPEGFKGVSMQRFEKPEGDPVIDTPAPVSKKRLEQNHQYKNDPRFNWTRTTAGGKRYTPKKRFAEEIAREEAVRVAAKK